jgi:signal transduction histidine kinase
MTLTSRLSMFFAGSLVLVLVGFSLCVHVVASRLLHRQADDRINSALNTLAAAAEINAAGVEWEPRERHLALVPRPQDQPVSWLVLDPDGQRVDSSEVVPAGFAAEAARLSSAGRARARSRLGSEAWRLVQRRLSADASHPGPIPPPDGPDEKRHAFLTIAVGHSLEPVEATLRALAGILSALTLGIGLIAGVASRWVCRRALAPVSMMAEHTRAMGASSLDERLPWARSGDELEELGAAFNGLLDRLQESFERQRRFTGDASNQLRTPLTAMLGQIEVALRKDRTAEDYRQVLTGLQRQGQYLRRIVESLLFLARADSEGRLADLEPIDLVAWLPEYLETWAGHPRWNDLELIRVPEGPAWVAGQAVLLGELLSNLIDNAFKYSEPGSPVRLGLESEDSSVRLAVEDRGIGIGQDDHAGLFRPFFRADQARRRGIAGLGLGLAVASRLARSFGGNITAMSRGAQGSRFVVSLPALDPMRRPAELTGVSSAAAESAG